MWDALRSTRGILRSLGIYYGDRRRRAAMDALYGRFVRPGDLVFDIGAHVGDRVAAFRRLGARVVAVEPQPAFAGVLRMMYGRDAMIAIEPAAVGRLPGTTELMINIDNPTVSTASPDFVRAASGAKGWEGQAWTRRLTVPLTTLDDLIERHGVPVFVKIDVEGFEAEALTGLTRPVPALSFEFTTIQRRVALDCVALCERLGLARFDASLGETHTLVHGRWRSGDEIRDWLSWLPHKANSGDVYAIAR